MLVAGFCHSTSSPLRYVSYSQDAVEAVTAEAVAAGAFGSSTTRYIQDAARAVPSGATLTVVRVRDRRVGAGQQSNAAATVATAAATVAAAAALASGATASTKLAIASKSKRIPSKAATVAAAAAAAVVAAEQLCSGSATLQVAEAGLGLAPRPAARGFREYPQAFEASGRRLCIHCMVPVADCR